MCLLFQQESTIMQSFLHCSASLQAGTHSARTFTIFLTSDEATRTSAFCLAAPARRLRRIGTGHSLPLILADARRPNPPALLLALAPSVDLPP